MTGQDLTAAEVADLFHVSEQTAKRWARHDKLPSRLVKGRRRYPAAAVAELARDRNIPLPDWLRGIAANAPKASP
jgi:predicted site-specific integrase-resolvase